jgi:hypothetical protein
MFKSDGRITLQVLVSIFVLSSYIKNRRYATVYVITVSLFSQHVSALSGHHQVQLVETFTLHRNSKNLFLFFIFLLKLNSAVLGAVVRF